MKLFDNQIEVEAEPGQMVEHSLGIAAISRTAVSANAFLDGSIYQSIFGRVVEHLVERAINCLAIDPLQRKLSCKPGSSHGPHAETMARVILGEPAVVYIAQFFQANYAIVDQTSIRSWL